MITSEIVSENDQVNVSLEVVWHGAAGNFNARIGAISMHGCFIESAGEEVMGEIVNFNVCLPSGIWVTLEGEVIDQDFSTGFEVQFTNLSPDNLRLLTHVVAAHGGPLALQAVKEEAQRIASGQIQGNSRRVLVADDDAMTLEIVKAILEKQGYGVVCASDGREAFRILRDDVNFCAAIFDMNMPHVDGLGLVHYVKMDKRLNHIPVGMITAEHDPKIWNDGMAAGVKVVLSKPFTAPQIEMMLRMLDKNAEVQQLSQSA
jgi:CheY-like chemotaxis protein